MFARLAINYPAISGIFDYTVPDDLAPQVQIGCLVTAPFGKQTVQGVILELSESSSIEKTKPIFDLLDPAPVLTPPQLALAIQMAESTLNPLAAVVGLMLPAGLSQQADISYELRDAGFPDQMPIIAARLLKLLRERGPLRGRQIDSHFGRVDWRKSAQALVRKGVFSSKYVLPPPRVRPKYLRVAQLSVPPEEAEAELPNLGTTQTLARRQAALRFLIRQPLAINLSWVYAETGCNLSDLRELEDRGLIRLFENEIFRDPLEKTGKLLHADSRVLTLTPDQASAYEQIRSVISSGVERKTFLLQGITGAGKTEVYLRATDEVIQRGSQAVILVPEIALTPQIVHRFLARFPGQVGLVHSKLSEGERYDTWRRARGGLLKVVIGARSALFSPLPNIGLIVADECHDSSYYQADQPFYHAVTVAQTYARLAGAVCVLGSATPSIVQRYQADGSPLLKGEGLGGRSMTRLELPRRIFESGLPPVQVVDMRDE